MEQKTHDLKPIGILVAVIGGLAAIGAAVWFSHNANPLLALILLAWGIERVNAAKNPAMLGLVLGLAYIVIGAVAWYTNDTNVLWAMVLANWLGDSII